MIHPVYGEDGEYGEDGDRACILRIESKWQIPWRNPEHVVDCR